MICPLISTTEKGGPAAGHRRADKVTGMQFPLSVRLAKRAAGSTVMPSATNFLRSQPLRVGRSVPPITACDFVNHQSRSGFVYRPA
jgi:hypothetical protein